MILAFQVLLALAYTVLAHLSNALDRPGLGAIALALLALMLLLAPMARRRWWAWLALPSLWLGVLVLYCDGLVRAPMLLVPVAFVALVAGGRSEEHTSELQSLMRNSYGGVCQNNKKRERIMTTENRV